MFDPASDMEEDAVMLLEASDVAREVGTSASTIRQAADDGRLPVHARTPRGLRLFTPEAVATLKAARAARRPPVLGLETRPAPLVRR